MKCLFCWYRKMPGTVHDASYGSMGTIYNFTNSIRNSTLSFFLQKINYLLHYAASTPSTIWSVPPSNQVCKSMWLADTCRKTFQLQLKNCTWAYLLVTFAIRLTMKTISTAYNNNITIIISQFIYACKKIKTIRLIKENSSMIDTLLAYLMHNNTMHVKLRCPSFPLTCHHEDTLMVHNRLLYL